MSKHLKDYEPYQRYNSEKTIPDKTPAIEDGQELFLGETRCRVKEDGEFCGKRFESTGALKNHMKKYHSEIKLLESKTTGNPSMEKIKNARDFYRTNMSETPKTALPSSSEHVQNTTSDRRRNRNRRSARDETEENPLIDNSEKNRNPLASPSQPVPAPPAHQYFTIRHQKANKRKKIKKGDVNFDAMEALLKSAGVQIPCSECVMSGKDDCDWDSSGTCILWGYFTERGNES